MKTILKRGKKIFNKYIWIVSVFYVIGYILIRIQFAQHGISEVQIFKERYLLASIMFVIYCLPIIIIESVLERKRKKEQKIGIDTTLLTIAVSIGIAYFISTLPAVIYTDRSYGNYIDIIAIVTTTISLFIAIIIEKVANKTKNKIKVIDSIYAIACIILFVGLSISSYRSFEVKEDWLNMYITSFFIMQTTLIIRLIIEKSYVRKQNEIPINKKCNRAKLATLLITLLLYGNFVFKSLPLEIGGGKLTSVKVETEDQLILQEIQNKNVYLLDRSGDTYILVIEEDKDKEIYNTIEVSKDQAIISITRKVTVKYFK